MKPLKKLKTETLIDNKYAKVLADTIELPDGRQKVWYRQDKPDVVMVCPITKDGKVILQRDYRYGVDAEMVEFCAGWIDEGETAESTAHRELLEETGYKAEKMTLIGKGVANPTWSQSVIWFFVAEGCELGDGQHLRGVEQVEPFMVDNLMKAKEYIMKEELPDATSMALFGYLPKEILTQYS